MSERFEACGGCGAKQPVQRCIGCLHDFGPTKTGNPTTDHAELARLAEAVTGREWWSDDNTICRQEISRGDERFIYALTPARVLALLAEIAALRGREERLRLGAAKANEEVCQTLGKAMGYPWFKDDQMNFPGSTEADGVCVGDHVAESIADEAARRITQAERQRDEAVKDRDGWVDNYSGALDDIDSLLKVLISRINGEKDLASAAEWVRLNYPIAAEAINASMEPKT